MLVLLDELIRAQQWMKVDKVQTQIEALYWSLQGWQQEEALPDLVDAFVKTQRWENVVMLVKRGTVSQQRMNLLTDLVERLIEAKQLEKAGELLAMIEPSKEKLNLQRRLGLELAVVEDWKNIDLLIEEVLFTLSSSEINQELSIPRDEDIFFPIKKYFEMLQWRQDGVRHNAFSLLLELSKSFVHGQQWERARNVWGETERLIRSAVSNEEKMLFLNTLVELLSQVREFNYLLRLLRYEWLQANTRNHAISLLSLAYGFIPLSPEIGSAFGEAFIWADDFLKI